MRQDVLPKRVGVPSHALARAGRRLVGMMLVTLAGLSTVLVAYFYVQQREYNRFTFQNVVWEGAQLRNEYQAFRAALLNFGERMPNTSAADVQRRYDILYGRVSVLRDGKSGEIYIEDPRLRDLLASIEVAIRDVDKPLTSYLRGGSPDNGRAIVSAMNRMDPDFSAFASQVNMIGIHRVEEARVRLNEIYNLLVGVTALTWLLMFGFAVALLRQLTTTERAHTDLAKLTADLEQARHEAVEASRAKSNFLATMSHELRTPMNAILGFADIMRQQMFGPVGNQRYVEYVEGIASSGQHLLSLINDVLDMSRIEAGRVELKEELLSVRDSIEEAIDVVAVTADRAGVKLRHTVPEGLPGLLADQRVVRQILLNLLSNAVKFTPRGGHVEILAALLPNGTMEIQVCDTGSGMTEAQLARAFEPFSHNDSLRARRTRGTGLGLPITRRLMELHGGTIALESRRSGGTRATLIFPAIRVGPRFGAI